jgi:23S rRNA (uracil1939-C5)-methyltransferase
MAKDTVFEITIDAMRHDGQGVGRHHGKATFVYGTIPGERVRVRVIEDHSRWSRAELLRVLDPSPDRVEPPCPYFGACGGCHWQHIAYPVQLAFKQQIVTRQLQRTGHIAAPAVRSTRGMAEPWHYRNHAQFALTATGALGFRAAHSHDIVAIDHCMLLHPLLDELHDALDVEWVELERLSLRAGINTGEQMVVFEPKQDLFPAIEVDMPVSCVLHLPDGSDVALVGDTAYRELLGDRPYLVSAGSFFQVNTLQAEVLLAQVHDYLDLDESDVLLDVYCGVGTLGLSMADQVARVIGIEESPSAIWDARVNAEDDPAVTLIEGRAEQVMGQIDDRVTKVVIDPPRQGCKPEVIEALIGLAPRRLVYVSCDPTTFARDAHALVDGGYALREVLPVDMFPQTHHIEVVSLWLRAESST